ncbi:hypothetical protein GYMLUDRAFT_67914 [Collybiopsis luxurians FD-317 M1]|nr:hypothetical protein GYMLUDRAFT_67914 [Collybiopsis luxurians FD-317 M1]
MNGLNGDADTLGPIVQGLGLSTHTRTYVHRADDYTVDSLNSFTFGNATPSQINTRVEHDDDEDEEEDEEAYGGLEGIPPSAHVDVTPRPSVAHSDAISTTLSPPNARTAGTPASPSSSVSTSEAESDSRATSLVTPSTARTHASAGRIREDIEFSSDDDMFEFDNLDYSEEDAETGGDEQIEISSARFSVGTEYGPPGGFRDREGSVATLKMQRPAPSNEPLPDLASSVPTFISPFASPSVTAVTAPSSIAPTDTSSNGVDIDFNIDYITSFASEHDFVRPPTPNRDQSGPAHSQRKDSLGRFIPAWFSTLAGRKYSTATVASTSSNPNMMFMHDDSFAKGLLTWGGENYREQRKDWTFRRDPHPALRSGRVGGGGGLSKDGTGKEGREENLTTRLRTISNATRLSTTTTAVPVVATNNAAATNVSTLAGDAEKELSESHKDNYSPKERDKEKERDRDKAKEREKDRMRRSTRYWRGMAIDSEEVWNNDLLGNFTVSREEAGKRGTGHASESVKGPQQRLVVRFRPPSSSISSSSSFKANLQKSAYAEPHFNLPHPPVIVHKHSKAMAFSITRYYRSISLGTSRGPTVAGRLSTSGPASSYPKLPGPAGPQPSRAQSNRIILLAPRKVQEAFTSTTTTKMLADHGLLGDRDNDSKENKRDKDRERERDRRRKSLGAEGGSKSKPSTPTPSSAAADKVRRKKSTVASQELPFAAVPPVPPLHPESSLPAPLDTHKVSTMSRTSPSPSSPSSPSSPYTPNSNPSLAPSTPIADVEPSPTSSPPPTDAASQRISSYSDNADHTDTDASTRSITHESSTLFESSSSQSETSEATSASDTSSTPSRAPPPQRRRGPRRRRYHDRDGYHIDYNEGDSDSSSFENDDDSFGYGSSRMIRTPHSETYGTVDFNIIDRQRALQLIADPSSSSSSSSSPFSFLEIVTGKPRKGVIDSLGPSASALRATAAIYNPPWLTFPSRGKQEQQKRVVDNLNMSFKDVGLLPSTPRDPNARVNGGGGGAKNVAASGRRKSLGGPIGGKGKNGKKEKGRAPDPDRDVFSSVPQESLCMLLPLWPGDTDGPSCQHPFKIPEIPLERRMFLLVWYRALEPQLGKNGLKEGEDVALAVIDSLIGLPPEMEKERQKEKEKDKDKDKNKDKDKKEKKKDKSTSSGSGKESGKSSRASPASSNDSSGGFLRSSRSIGLGLGSGGGGTGSGHRSATASRDTSSNTASHTSSFHNPHSNMTWAQLHANDDRNILLHGFVINARKVAYCDLRGTGVRVPDEGLAVNGPLEEAWRECSVGMSMPSDLDTQPLPDPTILAVCHSRESGVEFDPEALVSLGLCRVLNPLPMGMVAEDFAGFGENGAGINGGLNGIGEEAREGNQEEWEMSAMGFKRKLTAVGRAAMEMCWIGGLALTSFGPS